MKHAITVTLLLAIALSGCSGGSESDTLFGEGSAGTVSQEKPSLQILSHRSYPSGSGNYLYIVGEVENTSASIAARFVKIYATLYDDTGRVSKVIATDYTYSDIDTINPDAKSPFKLMVSNWQSMKRYILQVDGSATDAANSFFEILSHSSYWSASGNYLYIVGEVRNNSSETLNYTKVLATLYSGDGSVVETDYTYTDIDSIPAGGTSPFQIMVGEWVGYTHYELQVE